MQNVLFLPNAIKDVDVTKDTIEYNQVLLNLIVYN